MRAALHHGEQVSRELALGEDIRYERVAAESQDAPGHAPSQPLG